MNAKRRDTTNAQQPTPGDKLCLECGQPDLFANPPKLDLSTFPDMAMPELEIPDLKWPEICSKCGQLRNSRETDSK